MQTKVDHVVALNAIDGSISANSTFIDSTSYTRVSAQYVVTGTVVGTAKLQVSNDLNISDSGTPTNWNDLTSGSKSLSSSGNFYLDPLLICAMAVRAVYTTTSGTGTVTGTLVFHDL